MMVLWCRLVVSGVAFGADAVVVGLVVCVRFVPWNDVDRHGVVLTAPLQRHRQSLPVAEGGLLGSRVWLGVVRDVALGNLRLGQPVTELLE